ncbi:MAG: hypothetical protein MCSN_4030 [Candidatus Microsyncoccus archaeolyticus]|nr:MAG: hypothetical protein MCSN_4030 [Candidatus Parcubacteria bacterium]
METSQKIINFIKDKGQVTAKEIVDEVGITRQALFRYHLNKLVEAGIIEKRGKSPKVFYSIKEKQKTRQSFSVPKEYADKIEDSYLIITSSGEEKRGIDGFTYWCEKNNLPIEKTAKEYIDTLKKYEKYKINGVIDGTEKFKNSFKEVFLDKVFYLDFYSIERFGKTKLGQVLLYAKNSQDKRLIKELVLEIKPKIEKIIKEFKIDGVGFIPPTVKREVQLMREIQKQLKLKTRIIEISKIKTDIIVPQKTLNKIEDRIENAQKTISVEENAVFSNILLIDDAVGSGATFNETARKIRKKGICENKIIGLAITGSFKGFDVISEV